jgi:glycosyltransferase involved in cell wall biosynthesis
MSATASPLVSVVIPVYNGEEFIAEAIESVLAQTYTNWDLTIGNNHSTDRTVAIAEAYAARDPRIRICTYPKFVSVIESHSNAFTLVSEQAAYCKIVDADDWLFPNCLEEMVKVAEAHPTIGMVASYVLSGTRVGAPGLPYPSTFMTGREVCRLRLLKSIKVFGGPSASLIRASIVREKRPFYNPLNYHGDIEAYLDLLKDHDFGYVHQVLSYMRTGEDSPTTDYLSRVNSVYALDVDEITKFGPVYLTDEERARRLKEVTRQYYRHLGRSVIELRGREFWHYHLKHFRAMGYRLSYARIALHAALQLLDLVGNPKRTIEAVFRRVAPSRRGTQHGAAVAPAPGTAR